MTKRIRPGGHEIMRGGVPYIYNLDLKKYGYSFIDRLATIDKTACHYTISNAVDAGKFEHLKEVKRFVKKMVDEIVKDIFK